MLQHGGKRKGSGRPKGSGSRTGTELRQAAQEHTRDALNVLIEVMQNTEHPQRLKAAELVLQRGHGAPKEAPISLDIINQFVDGKISAITASLMLEAEGLKVPSVMRHYFNAEIKAATHLSFHEMISDKARSPLPRS